MSKQKLRVDVFDLVMSIARVVDLMNPAVGRHHLRVAYWAYQLAEAIGLPDREKFEVAVAGLLHDVGAFSLQERLDLLEFEDTRPGEHAVAGSLILREFAPFAGIADLVRFHHTPWENGRGGIHAGEPVPMGSHLIHLADRVAVQISDASPVLGQVETICREISNRSGDVFVPGHVAALLGIKNREYLWLDAASNTIETVLKRNIQNCNREFSMEQLVAFSRLICRLIDFKSEFTATHSSGVAAVAIELSRLTGFSKYERRQVEISAYLHDLGKLAIPSEILEKAGALTQEERFIMRAHVYHTYQTLEPFEVLKLVSQWGALHQERLNGTGYPFGLGADDLPLGARIMAVADVFTALTEERPYRKGMDETSTLATLRSMAEQDELDPSLLEKVFLNFGFLNEIREAAQTSALREYSTFQSVLDRRIGSIR